VLHAIEAEERASRTSIHTFLFVLYKHDMFRRRSRRSSSFTGLRRPRDNARFPQNLKLFFAKTRIIVLVVVRIICEVCREEVGERPQLISQLLNFLCDFRVRGQQSGQVTDDAYLQTCCSHRPDVVLVLGLQDFYHIHWETNIPPILHMHTSLHACQASTLPPPSNA